MAMNNSGTEQELTELNEQMAEQERRGDDEAATFFRTILADDLIFRRASGAVVTKQQFLYDLTPDAFEVLNSSINDIQVHGEVAVVTVTVGAKRRGQGQEKQYLNVRRFVRRRGQWQLEGWLNTEMR
jgi:hypothetical protein